MKKKIIWKFLETPLGKMIAGVSEKGCCLLEFEDRRSLPAILRNLQAKHQAELVEGESPIIDQIETEINEYFIGQRVGFDIPLDIQGTSFQRKVWENLLQIPYGKTKSYGEIANLANNPKAVRAVGSANGANNIAIVIPCHRVIRSDGNLQGYGGGLWRKKKLLSLESDCLVNADQEKLENWFN
ncbi:MAG: methylated-DNA--[protein]-cysteine S-methyltransferase [Candidatus Kariarchaeaceae archaeon]|jgi:AraC family transcriptional regulator of adaptative response/methylated-DNA-[protein]-cysteine methyltransferase